MLPIVREVSVLLGNQVAIPSSSVDGPMTGHMRSFLFSLLMAVSIGAQADSANLERIETRYGTVDVREHSGGVDIRFRGKVVRSAEAASASLYRVTPNGKREFVIVDGWAPGLYCHHVFYLVELHTDGKAVASNQFGACQELRGAKFQGEDPLILLSDPYVPGQNRSSGTTNFEWKNGSIVQVSGEVPAKPPSECAEADDATKVGSSSIDPGHRAYKVTSKGRLQFLSAPDLGCEQTGVFVIAGDTVIADKRFGAYTFARYVNPKSGKPTQGWVLSSRLVEVSPP
jgi:hypothetical protein